MQDIHYYIDAEKGSDTNNDGHSEEYPLATYEEVLKRVAQITPRVILHILPSIYPEVTTE